MNNSVLVLTLALALPILGFADEGRPVFSPWASFGLELGVVDPVNNTWKDETSAFFQGSFVSNMQILPLISVVGEIGYSAPGNGFNAALGIQQQLLPLPITPFIDGMAGLRIVPDGDHTPKFGDRFGPSLGLDGGILFFRESSFQLRIKGGYEWTFNTEMDHGWKAAMAILFSDTRPGLKAIDVSR
jgi:hypothetical protein